MNKSNKTMFALTHVNSEGFRVLSRANQGRNHFETEAQANEYLAKFLANNSTDTLAQVYGKQALGTFAIRSGEAYHHGDFVGIYFDDPHTFTTVPEDSGIYNVADKPGFERGRRADKTKVARVYSLYDIRHGMGLCVSWDIHGQKFYDAFPLGSLEQCEPRKR